mgnify:CR=1 FL=1
MEVQLWLHRDFGNVSDGNRDKPPDVAVALSKRPAVFKYAGCNCPSVDVIGFRGAIFHRESNFAWRYRLPECFRVFLYMQLFLLRVRMPYANQASTGQVALSGEANVNRAVRFRSYAEGLSEELVLRRAGRLRRHWE